MSQTWGKTVPKAHISQRSKFANQGENITNHLKMTLINKTENLTACVMRRCFFSVIKQKHGFHRKETAGETAWAQTPNYFLAQSSPRSSGLPHKSHGCTQPLDNYCILKKSTAKFPLSWPGLNHSWAPFFFFFGCFLAVLSRTLHSALWTLLIPQKSCITLSHCCSQCGAMRNSVILHWHLIF
jgi:hypothetical protein